VLGTKVGRLVAAEFADPTRLVALGSSRLIRFGATRGVQIRKPIADRLLAAARDALPMPDAAIARQVLAADLALACDLDRQVSPSRGRTRSAAAVESVPNPDQRPGLGSGPGRELRRGAR
jgi:hypothetical protein